jgi:hypothetical protein
MPMPLPGTIPSMIFDERTGDFRAPTQAEYQQQLATPTPRMVVKQPQAGQRQMLDSTPSAEQQAAAQAASRKYWESRGVANFTADGSPIFLTREELARRRMAATDTTTEKE